MKQQLADLTKKLCSFESVDGNEEQKKAVIDFVSEWLRNHQIQTEIHPHKKHPALVATISGSTDKKIIFVAHLDVVPANPEMFDIKQDGDIIKGRGVADDKGAAAILMNLFKHFQGKAIPLTLQWIATTDEEIGSPTNEKTFLAYADHEDIAAVIVLDGGNENQMIYKEKGVIHLELSATGKAAHGSRPWLGENAIDNLLNFVKEIENLFANEPVEDPNHWHATVNLGYFRGGDIINKVPDKAEAGLDIRVTERHDPEKILTQVKSVLPNNVKIESHVVGKFFESKTDDPILKMYIQKMGKTTNKKMNLKAEHGASDGRHFGNRNYPVWMHLYAGGGIHGDDEWADVSSMERVCLGLIDFIKSLS